MVQNLSKSAFQPTILMDERERGTIRTYFESLPCHLRILTMDVGDYVVSAEIGIERKRGDDFTASLLDNRLFGQLKNLKEIFPTPILILEDFKLAFNRSAMKPSSIYGALVYLAYKMGISVIPSDNEEGTAQIIWGIARTCQLTGSFPPDSLEELRYPSSKEISREDQIYLLEGLQDVGEKRAEILLRTFHTPEDVFTAINYSEICFTTGGNPKGIEGPLQVISGLGPKFLQTNQPLIRNFACFQSFKK